MAGTREPAVQIEVPVLGVAGDRESRVREMHANLVRSTGGGLGLDQREIADLRQRETRQARDAGDRFEPILVDRDAPIAVRGLVTPQRERQRARAQRTSAGDDRAVSFAGIAFAQLRVQRHQRRAAFRHQQHAGGFPVEAVHEFEEAGLRAQRAQLLDDAAGDAAAAVHGDRSRFVDRDQVVVLQKDRQALRELRAGTAYGIVGTGIGGPLRPGLARGDRRNPEPIACLEPVIDRAPRAVHPDLAAADQPVQVALRDASASRDEEVVEPPPRVVLVDRHVRRRWHRRRRHLCAGSIHVAILSGSCAIVAHGNGHPRTSAVPDSGDDPVVCARSKRPRKPLPAPVSRVRIVPGDWRRGCIEARSAARLEEHPTAACAALRRAGAGRCEIF